MHWMLQEIMRTEVLKQETLSKYRNKHTCMWRVRPLVEIHSKHQASLASLTPSISYAHRISFCPPQSDEGSMYRCCSVNSAVSDSVFPNSNSKNDLHWSTSAFTTVGLLCWRNIPHSLTWCGSQNKGGGWALIFQDSHRHTQPHTKQARWTLLPRTHPPLSHPPSLFQRKLLWWW